ncbi:SIS domain-containing protein [Halocola ammonii]
MLKEKIQSYQKVFDQFFTDSEIISQMEAAEMEIRSAQRLFFVGNGGSNSICSHMMEDFCKIANYPTFAFSDAALITCFANDYGYDRAMAEWLKRHLHEGDLLIAISSSGNSANIINAVKQAKTSGAKTVTLSGFKPNNKLRTLGDVNIYTPAEDYGMVECFHQTILHMILDALGE